MTRLFLAAGVAALAIASAGSCEARRRPWPRRRWWAAGPAARRRRPWQRRRPRRWWRRPTGVSWWPRRRWRWRRSRRRWRMRAGRPRWRRSWSCGGFAAPQMPRQHGGGGERVASQGQQRQQLTAAASGAEPRLPASAGPNAAAGQNRDVQRQQVRKQAQNRGSDRQQMQVEQAQNRRLNREQMRVQQAQNRHVERQQFGGRQRRRRRMASIASSSAPSGCSSARQLRAFANQQFDDRDSSAGMVQPQWRGILPRSQQAYRQALTGRPSRR